MRVGWNIDRIAFFSWLFFSMCFAVFSLSWRQANVKIACMLLLQEVPMKRTNSYLDTPTMVDRWLYACAAFPIPAWDSKWYVSEIHLPFLPLVLHLEIMWLMRFLFLLPHNYLIKSLDSFAFPSWLETINLLACGMAYQNSKMLRKTLCGCG